MSYIVQAADEKPKHQVWSEEAGRTVAMCPDQYWAWKVAAAMNDAEKIEKLRQRNVEALDASGDPAK
jgi:hypothetical protein